MAVYVCPLCKQQVARDLVLFLDHTNQHIIERIQEAHPEWVAKDGGCQPCVEYYRKQLSGELSNIGPQGRRSRALMGIAFMIVSAASFFYMIIHESPRGSRVMLFFPLFLSFFGIFQARGKTCSILAEIGSEDGLKTKGRKIILHALLAAAILTLLFFLFPSASS